MAAMRGRALIRTGSCHRALGRYEEALEKFREATSVAYYCAPATMAAWLIDQEAQRQIGHTYKKMDEEARFISRKVSCLWPGGNLAS